MSFLTPWIFDFDFNLIWIAVILRESQQSDLNEKLAKTISETAISQQVTFDIKYIEVDRDQMDQSFSNCELKT